MPASPNSSGTAGSIVLVEEYGALAVAIGSALKKFAPGFAIRTVRSLAEAEGEIAKAKPDLLVFDFDPPDGAALDFFTRLKTTAPSTRVLIIAAAPVGGLTAPAANTGGAFYFVEKPFDLASLGAGIQSALRVDSPAHRRSQTLRELAARDAIALHSIAGSTTVLKIDASEGRSGEIHFTDGEITHAETIDSDGAAALRELLSWRSPRLKHAKRRPRALRSIEGSWSAVLLDATREAANEESEPPEREDERRETIGGGKKIVVIDDTEMLLVFVEDSLATADPTLEVSTASTGAEGVERVRTIKPDLVLLDYSLPDFNGDDVCKHLLADTTTAAIPVVMMSGHVPEMAASALRFENIVATVAKPFLSDALVDVVAKVLQDPEQFAVRPPMPAAVPPPSKLPESLPPEREHHGNGHRVPPAAAVATQSPGGGAKPASASAPPPVPPPAPSPPSTAVHAQTSGFTSTTKQAVAPPPPIPMMAPAPKPIVPRSVVTAVAEPKAAVATAAPASAPLAAPIGVAPARLAAAATNTVVLGLTLEVLAIQFSPTLQMAAIRARPASRTISLHVQPGALANMSLPEAGFDLGPVNLDARGQIDTIRLLPTAQRLGAIQPHHAFSVGAVSLMPANGGKAVELTPGAAAPMMMHLSAPFELAGVELSPAFGVGSLLLKARGGDIRVSLAREGGQTGATFKTAQVLLNRSAEIAEILLDAVA